MCKWYCTSEGPSTNLQCLHCKAYYCAACLHGQAGKMESLIKCAGCGGKPGTLAAKKRNTWQGESNSSSSHHVISSPSAAATRASDEDAGKAFATSMRNSRPGSATSSPKKSSGKGSIFDRLTDTNLYTGSHKHRFDADGNGRGLDGRESVAKGAGLNGAVRAHTGAAADLSTLLRNDQKLTTSPPVVSPTFKSTTASAPKSPSKSSSPAKSPSGKPKTSIFDKLTDPSQYTGAHKSRFDASGRGRGMAGRDGASGIEYGGGVVRDLSQITRS